MKISIKNTQKACLIDKKKIKKQVSFLLKKFQISCDEIAIYFVDEKKISSLHKKYFDDPSITDCISFPIDSKDSKIFPIFLGEIFVCPQMAVQYSQKKNIFLQEELSLYIIHGILHLLGYNDISKKEKILMKKKEKECMKLLKKEGFF